MQLLTTDQAAVAVLLSGAPERAQQAHLNRLLTATRVAHGLECQECGSESVCDNGASGVDLTHLCTDCGHQWSPNL